jgi:fatty acid synthase
MSTGKHTGKVLIEVRQEERGHRSINALPSEISVRAVCRALPNPAHAYIITGGLGGFGLELAQWLINRGAKR